MSATLFEVSKAKAKTLSIAIEHSPLHAKQAELKLKICKLGKLDRIMEAKKELSHIVGCFVAEERLKTDLRNLVNRIKPLGQIAGQPTHLSEMLASLETVLKQLPVVGTEMVRTPLEKLGNIYVEVQTQQKKKESTECCLVGFSTGYLYIDQKDIDKIVPLTAEGLVSRPLETGSRPVNFNDGIFWKYRPSAPLDERWAHWLAESSKSSSAPSEFVIVKRHVKDQLQTFSLQASLAVKGIAMQIVLSKYPDWIAKFDKRLVGFTAILHMYNYPQDAKPDNFIAVPHGDSEDPTSVTWSEIDGDACRSFPLFYVKMTGEHFINVRSFFFNLPQMYEPIHPDVRRFYTTVNPAAMVLQGFSEMWEKNRMVKEFVDQGFLSAKEMKEMRMPILFVKTYGFDLFKKVAGVVNFMRTASEETTLMDLFKSIVPELAWYYDLINQKFPNQPLAAFQEIFQGAGPVYEKIMKPFLNQPLLSDSPLSEDLKKITHHFEDYQEKRDTLPETCVEILLEQLDFAELSLEEQAQTLKLLERFPLTDITIRNCASLNDAALERFVSSQPHLRKLKLLGCSKLTDVALNILVCTHQRLELTLEEAPLITDAALEKTKEYFSKTEETPQTARVKHELFSKSSSLVADRTMQEFSKAVEQGNWSRVQEQMATFDQMNVKPKAVLIIIEKLMKTDLMRKIVKNNETGVLQFLFSLNILPTQRNINEETFLHLCCEEGNTKMLEELCSKPIVWQDLVAGTSPLRWSVENGNSEAAKTLIRAGAVLTELDQGRRNLMHLACQHSLEDILMLLFEKAPELIEQPDKMGRSPIFAAIEFGQRGCLDRLLTKLKTVDRPDKKGVTPLMYTAQLDRKAMMEALIAKGAKRDLTDLEEMNTLQIAALAGSINCFRGLLGPKPSLEVLGVLCRDKKTLHHLTALSGNLECVKELSQHTLAFKQMDERGMAPPHYAAAVGNWGIFSHYITLGLPVDFPKEKTNETSLMIALKGHHFLFADKIIATGANLNFINRAGFSILHIAAQEGDSELIRYLCEKKKVDVNSKTNRKLTPLHFSAASGQLGAIDTLHSLGATIDSLDPDKKTPLFSAIQSGRLEAARKLVALGADVRMQMSDGTSCLHYAAHYTHPKLVEFILSLHPEQVHSITSEDGHTPLHRAMYQDNAFSHLSPEEAELKKAKQLEVVRILVRYRARVNEHDAHDYVALHLGAKRGMEHLLQFLVSQGADVSVKNDRGRTAAEHGTYSAQSEASPDIKAAIARTVQFLDEQVSSRSLKKASTTSHYRSLTKAPRYTQDSKRRFLTLIKEEGGFSKETWSLAWRIEEQLAKSKSSFPADYQAILKGWNLTQYELIDWPEQQFAEFDSSEKLWEFYLKHLEAKEAVASLIPMVTQPPAFLQFLEDQLKKLPEDQLKPFCDLLLHLQGHEAWSASDFKNCKIANRLKGKETREAKKFLEAPKDAFSSPKLITDWKQKSLQARGSKLLEALNRIFVKERFKEKEKLIEQLTLSLMKMNQVWFSHVTLRDFVNPDDTSALSELLQTSKQLLANTVFFLFSQQDQGQRCRCFEFVIDWMAKSIEYGDFHQAYSLYQALTHPAVIRLKKTVKKLSSPSLEQLQLCASLFSPTLHFLHYDSHLTQRLTPTIPALSLSLRRLVDEPSLKTRFEDLRQIQNRRAFSSRFLFPDQDPLSEHLLFLTPDLYPKLTVSHPDKDPIFPGETAAWEISRQLEPPKI